MHNHHTEAAGRRELRNEAAMVAWVSLLRRARMAPVI